MMRTCKRLALGMAVWSATTLAGHAEDAPAKCEGPGYVAPTSANTHVAGEYPPLSMAMGEQGTTTLDFYIDEKGIPTDVKIATSSGSLRLDAAAQDTVSQNWRYVAGQKDGKPVRCTWRARVAWDLKNAAMALLPLDLFKSFATIIEPNAEQYPNGALNRGETGDDIFFVQVSNDKPSIELAKSSGHSDLDGAATDIVKQKAHQAVCRFDDRDATCRIMVVVAWRVAPPKKPEAKKLEAK